ncbi:MAG: FtsK/SpoIIIE domain-containing protein [Syntrophomonas sp.]
MDLLTAFGLGAVAWTALNFLPGRKPTTDDLILDTWRQLGVQTKEGLLPQKKKGAWFLPAGLSPKDIEQSLPALSYQLNSQVEMEVKGKAVLLHLYPPLPDRVPYELQDLSGYRLGLVLGRTHKQECLVLDLNDSSPYVLAAGGVGMGKSNLLNLILAQVNVNYTEKHLQYYLVDLKLGVELGRWADSPLCGGTCWDPNSDQLEAQLNYLSREIRRRMKIFKKLGLYKVDDYNQLPDVDRLPYLLLVVDEYAELRRDPDAEEKLQHLLQIGRAAGLRCILSTQRPTHDNISTSIKGLIPTRIAFSVADHTNSAVILDQGGAEQLGGIPGRALLLHGASIRQLQVMISPGPS